MIIVNEIIFFSTGQHFVQQVCCKMAQCVLVLINMMIEPVVCAAGMINVVNTTVQICSQGDWHTICGDTNTWTSAQARVACRQLGLSPNGNILLYE